MAQTIEYRAPLASRVGDTFVALALGSGLGLLSLLFPLGLGVAMVDEFHAPPLLAAGIAIPTMIAGVRLAWSAFAYRIRGCVIFHPQFLQIGDRWCAIRAGYGDVEEVAMPTGPEGDWLKLRIGGQAVRVVLKRNDLIEALNLLTKVCQNAVIISRDGTEHVSPDADPDFVRMTLQRRHRRLAFGSLLGGLFFALVFAGRTWVAIKWATAMWFSGSVRSSSSGSP